MNDMRAVIVPKSDQINADDLLGGPITITIAKVTIKPGTEQPVSINYENDNGKVYRPCKSMARVMVTCWGPDANEYVGRSMTLYCDPKVLWGGMAVGGIRISHMSHINNKHTMALTATKGSRKPFTVEPLKTAPVARQQTATPAWSEPADPTPEERYPTLFGVADGRVWLKNLDVVLLAAQTEDEVAEVGALSSVVLTLENAPPAVGAQVRSILAAATARVRSDAETETSAPTIENDPTHEAA